MKKQEEVTLNRGILDSITPVEINFSRNSMDIGERYMKGYGIIRYPSEVNLGWLSQITNITNSLVSVTFIPTSSGELLSAVSRNIAQMRGEAYATNDYIKQQRAEKGIENGEELIRRIDQDGESVGYFSCVISAVGNDEKSFKSACTAVEMKISSLNMQARAMSSLQKEAYECLAPYHVPNPKILKCTQRVMPISTYQYGMPVSSVNFTDDTGYYFGRDTNNGIVCVDMWKRGGDRQNSNWVVMGKPGSGKSFFTKHILMSEFMMGTKIYIIDPESEYGELTKYLGGDVINVCGSKEGKINPLQINTEKYDNFEDNEADNLGALAIHMKTVETFFDMYLEDLTAIQKAILKDVLIKVYEKHGITFETDVTDLHETDYPVLQDVYDYIVEQYKKTDDKEYNTLAMLLKDATSGSDQFLWNGHTTIHSDKQIVCLDTHDIQQAPAHIKKTQYFNALTWVWEQASKNRNEHCIIVCDEAYLMIDQRVPQALIYLRNIAKRGRKYGIGLMIISHSVVDFLSPSIKQYGQELLGTTGYKAFFNCDGKNLKELGNLYDLKDMEMEYLLKADRGSGLVTIGSKRLKIKFEVSQEKTNIINGEYEKNSQEKGNG